MTDASSVVVIDSDKLSAIQGGTSNSDQTDFFVANVAEQFRAYYISQGGANAKYYSFGTAGSGSQNGPTITLIGDNPYEILVGGTYSEAGGNADGGETVVVVSNNVNVNQIGQYSVVYAAANANNDVGTATRTVNVQEAPDTTKPVISLVGNATVTITVGDSYNDAGATASDNKDGDITSNIVTVNPVDTNTAGTYTVTYNVSDAAGNAATEVTRTVTVQEAPDTTKPVISLVGNATVTITVGDSYNDAGATASDNKDGDITSNIVTVNPVDTNTAGTYTVTYNVSDAAGNAATEVTRTVVIEAAAGSPDMFSLTATSVDVNNQGTTELSFGYDANGVNAELPPLPPGWDARFKGLYTPSFAVDYIAGTNGYTTFHLDNTDTPNKVNNSNGYWLYFDITHECDITWDQEKCAELFSFCEIYNANTYASVANMRTSSSYSPRDPFGPPQLVKNYYVFFAYNV